MDTRKIFPVRLAELRKERGLTQSELADCIGISRQSVTLYERETRIPDIEVLGKLASFLGVTADYLIGLDDARTHEAADIAARTGLTEEAVEVLEYFQRSEQIMIPNVSICDISIAGILSEIIEAAMGKKTLHEFLAWYTPAFDIKHSDGSISNISIDVIMQQNGVKRIEYVERLSEENLEL